MTAARLAPTAEFAQQAVGTCGGRLTCRITRASHIVFTIAFSMSSLASGRAHAQDGSVSAPLDPPHEAAADTSQASTLPPPITPLRYTEDYSYLLDEAARSGAWWEPLKYIPLDEQGHSFLTLGGELRFRTETYWNKSFGAPPVENDGYGWYRALPYADLHLGSNLRLFGQLNIAYATGVEPARSPIDETGVDVLQGFAELRLPTSDASASEITLRGGRQLLSYGSERLIGTRYGPNVLQSFDGGVGRLDVGDWRLDAFYTRPVQNRLESFDDGSDAQRELWSLYATRALPAIGPESGLDLYVIGYGNERAAFEQGAGPEGRYTLGGRFFGSVSDLRWDLEGFYQTGRFNGGDIAAWSAASDVRYTFSNLTLKPYLELRANIVSGDESPSDPDLQTFNALFPKGKYFGEIGLIGPSNLINLHPIVGVDLGNGWSLSGAAVFYWRESLDDGVYGASGNLLRADAGQSDARYIGTQADLVLDWQANRNLSVGAAYSVFEAGQFIEESGSSETVHFFGLETLFRF